MITHHHHHHHHQQQQHQLQQQQQQQQPQQQQQQQQQQQHQQQQQQHQEQQPHQEYITTDILQNNRPHNGDSTTPPSDSNSNPNSMSTATPPSSGQIYSRASPASTALIMSSNNIDHIQPSSRQLSPNNSSPSNNGTGSSSNGAASHHHHHAHDSGPPNPMIRQFACHAKSMSAGVVVSVPGISNNLATLTGMNQNNMINNHIATSNRQQQAAMAAIPIDSSAFIAGHHQNSASGNHHTSHRVHQSSGGQQVFTSRTHHRNHNQQLSQQSSTHQYHHNHQQHQHQQQPPPLPQPAHQYSSHHSSQNGSNSNNFLNHHQSGGHTSLIPSHGINSNHPPQSHHNRSASAHLSGAQIIGHNNQANNNSSHHTQSNHHLTAARHPNYPNNVTNSIWSIDEHMSKSQSKLGSSGYIPSYLYNPSLNDGMSCDNVSNGSRLPDGTAAPGYYTHAPSGANLPPNSNGLSVSGSLKTPEFLPICDLMFNLISMIVYFCENTFGIIALIALYYHSTNRYWALIGALFVVCSNTISQYLSFKWLFKAKLEDCKRKREAQEELEDEEDCERRYYNRMAANMGDYPCGSCAWLPDSATEVQLKFLISITIDAILHLFCLGFLVRYVKLVIPVKDLARVRKEARDLCMLRMVHAFIQSAPLLLLQAYMVCSLNGSSSSIISLSVTSASLSLVNVCWALASFTKYARKKYLHKFELPWLGVLSQLMWRLGTVSSRVVALTIYGVYYNYWMLVVLALHWLTMFLWLMKPGNLLRDEVSLSRPKKISSAAAIAWIYCFCYLNFEEHNSKLKMTSYYLIMFLENNLLLTVCLIFSSQFTWFKNLSILVVYLGFVFGMLFMFIYYKYFHLNILNNGLSHSRESIDSIADQLSPAGKKIAGFKPGTLRLKSEESISSGQKYDTNINANTHTGSHPEITRNIKPPYLSSSQVPLSQSGVLNCTTGSRRHKIPSANIRRHNQ